MKRSKQMFFTSALVALLTTGGLGIASLASARAADTEMPSGMTMSGDMPMPSTAAEHNAEAAKYDREAASLDAKADLHAKMATNYRAQAGAGSKQGANFQSLANHCAGLSKAYRDAAVQARAMAESHRSAAKAG